MLSNYSAETNKIVELIENYEASLPIEANKKILREINLPGNLKANLEYLDYYLNNLDVKLDVVVMGKFKSGKSSFLNHLIERDIAVVDVERMTYSLNYITYGEKANCTLIYNSKKHESMTIDEVNKILIENRGVVAFQKNLEKIEFSYPYEELKNVNLWDTPGLGANNELDREKTISIMKDADVILWLLDITAIGDSGDKTYLDRLLTLNKPIVCIVNKIDRVDDFESHKFETLEYINDIYPNSFSKLFFCGSLNKAIGEGIGIQDIKRFLETNIFQKKKELIIKSTINSIKNIIQNIENTLDTFRDEIEGNLQNYKNFEDEINDRVAKLLPGLMADVDRYVSSVVYEEEYKIILSKIKSEKNISSEKYEKEIINLLENSSRKYVEDLILMIKGKMNDYWKNVIYKSSEILLYEDGEFIISQNDLIKKDTEIVSNLPSNLFSEADLKIGAGVGSLTGAASIIAGNALAASIAGGMFAGIGVVALQAYFKVKESKRITEETTKIRNIIDKEKKDFNRKVVRGNIQNNIQLLNNDLKSKLLNDASLKILKSGNYYDNKNISKRISKFLESKDATYDILDRYYTEHVEDDIFRKRVKLTNFIIFRDNPNTGIEKLVAVLTTASRFVYFVDPYFDEKSISWIKQINSEIPVKILLYFIDQQIEQHNVFLTRLQELRNGRNAGINVRLLKYKFQKGTPLHDRFIFSGDWGIQLGNGLDAIGKQDISVNFISETKRFKENFFDKYWDAKSIQFEDKEKQIIKYDL